MKTKICRLCKIEKSILEFWKSKHNKGGLRHECKICARKEYKKYSKDYHNSPHRKAQIRNYRLIKTYGISALDWSNLFNKQQEKCIICGRYQSEFKKDLAVDHCHKTGKVRGLLCTSCNAKIGWFEEFGERIVEYLNE